MAEERQSSAFERKGRASRGATPATDVEVEKASARGEREASERRERRSGAAAQRRSGAAARKR